MKGDNFRRQARIRWRRGQWATVAAFLRGEQNSRTRGPGMEIPEDGTTSPLEAAQRAIGLGRSGQVPMSRRLDQLDEKLR